MIKNKRLINALFGTKKSLLDNKALKIWFRFNFELFFNFQSTYTSSGVPDSLTEEI